MEKQKAQFKAALIAIGFPEDKATAQVEAFFPSDESVEPVLDISTLQTQAQEYSKPFLKEHFKKELSTDFKLQYKNDFFRKLAQESGGAVKFTDLEGKEFAEGAKIALEKVSSAKGATDEQKDEMIRVLNEEKAAFEHKMTEAVEAVKGEYQAKETQRTIQAGMLTTLGGKTLTVKPDMATPVILNALADKYSVQWNDATKTFDLYDKSDPTKKAQKDATNFANANEEIDALVEAYGWVAKSNGGQGQQQQQQNQPSTPALPIKPATTASRQQGNGADGLYTAMVQTGAVPAGQ